MLRVAMLTTYKIDMAVALEHMAAREGILTGSQQPQKRTRERGDDDEGPPDKHNDFSKSRSAFFDSLCCRCCIFKQ